MMGILAAQLLLVVSHDLAARGQLHQLERYADRLQLVVSLGQGNAISDSALQALARWPALVTVEIASPLKPGEARALQALQRLAVRLPPRAEAVPGTDAGSKNESPFISLKASREELPSLALLGPALVLAERAPPTALAPGPCAGSEERVAPSGERELRVEGELTACIVDWLHRRLDPHSEPLDEISPGTRPPAKDAAPRH